MACHSHFSNPDKGVNKSGLGRSAKGNVNRSGLGRPAAPNVNKVEANAGSQGGPLVRALKSDSATRKTDMASRGMKTMSLPK